MVVKQWRERLLDDPPADPNPMEISYMRDTAPPRLGPTIPAQASSVAVKPAVPPSTIELIHGAAFSAVSLAPASSLAQKVRVGQPWVLPPTDAHTVGPADDCMAETCTNVVEAHPSKPVISNSDRIAISRGVAQEAAPPSIKQRSSAPSNIHRFAAPTRASNPGSVIAPDVPPARVLPPSTGNGPTLCPSEMYIHPTRRIYIKEELEILYNLFPQAASQSISKRWLIIGELHTPAPISHQSSEDIYKYQQLRLARRLQRLRRLMTVEDSRFCHVARVTAGRVHTVLEPPLHLVSDLLLYTAMRHVTRDTIQQPNGSMDLVHAWTSIKRFAYTLSFLPPPPDEEGLRCETVDLEMHMVCAEAVLSHPVFQALVRDYLTVRHRSDKPTRPVLDWSSGVVIPVVLANVRDPIAYAKNFWAHTSLDDDSRLSFFLDPANRRSWISGHRVQKEPDASSRHRDRVPVFEHPSVIALQAAQVLCGNQLYAGQVSIRRADTSGSQPPAGQNPTPHKEGPLSGGEQAVVPEGFTSVAPPAIAARRPQRPSCALPANPSRSDADLHPSTTVGGQAPPASGACEAGGGVQEANINPLLVSRDTQSSISSHSGVQPHRRQITIRDAPITQSTRTLSSSASENPPLSRCSTQERLREPPQTSLLRRNARSTDFDQLVASSVPEDEPRLTSHTAQSSISTATSVLPTPNLAQENASTHELPRVVSGWSRESSSAALTAGMRGLLAGEYGGEADDDGVVYMGTHHKGESAGLRGPRRAVPAQARASADAAPNAIPGPSHFDRRSLHGDIGDAVEAGNMAQRAVRDAAAEQRRVWTAVGSDSVIVEDAGPAKRVRVAHTPDGSPPRRTDDNMMSRSHPHLPPLRIRPDQHPSIGGLRLPSLTRLVDERENQGDIDMTGPAEVPARSWWIAHMANVREP